MARRASKKKVAKKRATPGATPRTGKSATATTLPGWLWLGAGVFIGLFIALLVFLQLQPEQQERRQGEETVSVPAERVQVGAVEAGGRKPDSGPEQPPSRFEFYSILPEREVLVPEQEAGPEVPAGKAAPAKKPGRYMLQAGSFRRYADADRRRARLALLGIESRIQVVKTAEGDTWHRVRIGPFDSLRELDVVRRRLNENDIDTLLVRIKG